MSRQDEAGDDADTDEPDEASFYAILQRYPDEESAVRYFEEQRWPNGPVCPSCRSSEVTRGVQGGRNRQLFRCHNCDGQFSVTSGTVMEATKLPLQKWLLAFHLMGASKKGISALQMSRMLDVTYQTGWFLCHRIRETMVENDQKFTGIVESDETYIGGKRKHVGSGYRGDKAAVQIVARRNSPGEHDGLIQTIALDKADHVDGRTVGAKLRTHTEPQNTVLMTDESNIYTKVGEDFAEHHVVNHKKEDYAHTELDGHLASTNTAEGAFGNLKRQIDGTHHHVSREHLPKYLEEYDYKYNTRGVSDVTRTEAAIQNMEGKRLTLYKPAGGKGESLYDRKPGEPAPPRVPRTRPGEEEDPPYEGVRHGPRWGEPVPERTPRGAERAERGKEDEDA